MDAVRGLLAFLFLTCAAEAGLLGGHQEIATDSTTIQDVAHRALVDRNTKSNNLYHDSLIKVVEATSQVVNGINYNLKMYIGPTSCTKREVKPEALKDAKCELNSGNDAELCNVKAYSQPWTNTFQVNEFSCSHVSRAEAMQA